MRRRPRCCWRARQALDGTRRAPNVHASTTSCANARARPGLRQRATFLYVTLEHLKRLEGEVLNQLAGELGRPAGRFETEGITVDPHQLLGIELNPRAAAIAELVLWIGYLQWHFRTRGNAVPPQPVLRDFKQHRMHRDAVLAYDRVEFAYDDAGRHPPHALGRPHLQEKPVTGEDVPDDSARMPQ
jgi:hypothetical protein